MGDCGVELFSGRAVDLQKVLGQLAGEDEHREGAALLFKEGGHRLVLPQTMACSAGTVATEVGRPPGNGAGLLTIRWIRASSMLMGSCLS